jgi:hypothetical protein
MVLAIPITINHFYSRARGEGWSQVAILTHHRMQVSCAALEMPNDSRPRKRRSDPCGCYPGVSHQHSLRSETCSLWDSVQDCLVMMPESGLISCGASTINVYGLNWAALADDFRTFLLNPDFLN